MFNFLPGSGIFALAGLIAAAGPVLIHLLNRRRFRVVNWAAMDFLLEALQRNRRMLHMRDLLLLALRTACVLLFGLALARPFLSHTAASTTANEPLHAVLVIDNSLSMGYKSKLDRTLLDEAKSKAREFIEDLPAGSRISVLPLCGSAASFSLDAYRTKEDARDALDKIEVVDRTGGASQAADLARQAIAQVPDMPAKRVAFVGDQQLIDWPSESLSEQLKDLPELQVVALGAEDHENSWIADFSIMDGVADVETPALFSVTVQHDGPPRPNVQVTLSVDGTEVGSETIDLEKDQSREVTFKYRFDAGVEPGKSVFVPARVSIPGDHLEGDDFRVLSVPVVAALPVVFVDQYGSDEDRKRNRYGETLHLRRLLAPVTARGDTNRQLVEIRHLKIDQVDRESLKDARLVVIAGVANPEGAVPVLRDYVKQGGQLVIAAGADFDPAQWNQAAWLDGAGILPVPLKPQPIGKMPEETSGELKPFFLSYPSMSAHDVFQLANTSKEELENLYTSPVFFKAIESDMSEETLATQVAAEVKRIESDREFLAEAREKMTKWSEKEARGLLTEEDRGNRNDLEDKLATVDPTWLLWPERKAQENDAKSSVLAERTRPRTLAEFDNKVPFLVERAIGQGRVLLVTSGVFSNWNTLPKDKAVVIYDRLLRGMLARTLPERNLDSAEQITIPVVDRNGIYTLKRPDAPEGQSPEVLQVDALGADVYGVTVNNLTARGIYTVTAAKGDVSAENEGAAAKLWELNLAVNGPPRESELAVIDQATLKDRMGDANYRWVGPGEQINLEGAQVRFQDLWKWLILLVLVGLLVEMFILARPMLTRERAT